MAVPNTFATDTGSIPLADLDANFSYYDGAFNIASNIFTFTDTVNFQDVADPTKIGAFSFAGIPTATTRTYTFPNLTGTLATIGTLTQTFTGTTTFSGTFTASGTTTTLGSGTTAITANVGSGATTTGVTKTINIGTAGVSGSITNINIGSAVSGATGTTTINSPNVLYLGNVQLQTGAVMPYAPAPTGIAAATTLANADIQGQIISATGTTYTITMPLGTTLDTLATWSTTNISYDFYVINTATGVITMAVNTGVTSLGLLTISAATSAHFRIRRTAASTYVLYRLS